MEGILQDLRYAFRTLRRDVGFTTFAILIVGLGIGASTTVFSVVDALLLRPLPYAHADRLVDLSHTLAMIFEKSSTRTHCRTSSGLP